MQRVPTALPVAGATVGCALTGAFIVHGSSVISLLSVAVLGTMALVALNRALIRWKDDPDAANRILKWTLVALAVHLVIGLLITSSDVLVNYLGPDARTYNAGARALVDHWAHGGAAPLFQSGKEGYYYVLGALYWAFGASTFGGIALNAVFGAALVPVVSDTTHRLFGAAAARYTAPLMLLVPGMIVWTSQLLKEAPFLLLLALAANAAARLVDRISLGSLLVLALALPLLLTLRGQLAIVILGGLVLGIVLGRQVLSGGVFGGIIASLLIAAVVGLGVGSAGYGKAVNSNLQEANLVRQGLAEAGNSGFQSEADISTVGRALSFLPTGLVVVAVGPFPWQLGGARQLVAIPDIIAWWYLIVMFASGWLAARRRSGRRLLVLVIPAVACMIEIALVVGNYGTIVRERMQILVLLAPVMALGLAVRRARREGQDGAALARPAPASLATV
jgi:hypothetical membrane protein